MLFKVVALPLRSLARVRLCCGHSGNISVLDPTWIGSHSWVRFSVSEWEAQLGTLTQRTSPTEAHRATASLKDRPSSGGKGELRSHVWLFMLQPTVTYYFHTGFIRSPPPPLPHLSATKQMEYLGSIAISATHTQ